MYMLIYEYVHILVAFLLVTEKLTMNNLKENTLILVYNQVALLLHHSKKDMVVRGPGEVKQTREGVTLDSTVNFFVLAETVAGFL